MNEPSVSRREELLKRALSEKIDRRAVQIAPIAAVGRGRPLPLSFAQQRLWFLSQLDETGEAHHLDDGIRLEGVLDRRAFRAALDQIVERHEILRTRFVLVDGLPAQVIDGGGGFPLIEEDLRHHDDVETEFRRIARQESSRPFDLGRGPLVRGRLLRLAEETHVFLFAMHHIVCDGWSMGILIRELCTLYAACCDGDRKGGLLPALAVQYADYAAWQRQRLGAADMAKQLGYWEAALGDAPPLLDIPTTYPRPGQRTGESGTREIVLDKALVLRLQALCKRRTMTLFMAMLAGWAILLARLSGQRDIVIGTPVSNRLRVETEPLIGFFANTLAIRLDFRRYGKSMSVADMLDLVKARVLEAQRHQEIPFEQVVEAVRPPRRFGRAPLLQVMFAWQGAAQAAMRLPGLTVSPVRSTHRATQFELTLSVGETNGTVAGHLVYAASLFDRTTIDSYVEAWQALLEAMAGDLSRPIDDLPLMPAAMQHRLMSDCNVPTDGPREFAFVHEAIAARAKAAPDTVAVLQDAKALSYGELDARAARLALHLRARGVGPDVLVGVAARKCASTIVGMLAVLRAGGAYVAMDPHAPASVLAHVLADSSPALVLTDTATYPLLAGMCDGVPVLDLQAGEPPWTETGDVPTTVVPGLAAGNLAYVVYTSGSTGRAKGVMVEHRSLGSLVEWHVGTFGLVPGSAVSSVASLGFDAAVWEIWPALCAGATLHFPSPQAGTGDIAGLLAWWLRQPLDVGFLPTPIAEYAFEHGISHPTLRVLLVGGDRLRRMPARPHVPVVNNYGPTEATVVAVSGRLDCGQEELPLGSPTSHGRIYILDPAGHVLPRGITGEIYIGGAGVARGYLNRPDLSAERFLPDPFSAQAGARMYRTGDLGRWLPDGAIAFAGRNDCQVKLRGIRVEPGEIEAALREHPAVSEAVVTTGQGGTDVVLVAYVVPAAGKRVPDSRVLRRHLEARLPTYMLPVAYVGLEAWPLTINGKLDRNALPAPQVGDACVDGYEAPSGEREAALARIWCELLKIRRVGRNDNFFELGGHSILCAELNFRIFTEFNVDVGIRYLYEYPVLREVAERIELLARAGSLERSGNEARPLGTLEI